VGGEYVTRCNSKAVVNYSDISQELWDEFNNAPTLLQYKIGKRSYRPTAIYVDSIGLGAGVADRLRELDLPCVDVNVSESPSMKDRYTRLRAELWYAVRGWLEQRSVCLPRDLPMWKSS
jgi:hypothetical protein